jgi:hypothetical protein
MKPVTAWHADPVGVARGVIGCGLLVGAPRLAKQLSLSSHRPAVTLAARALGVRHLAEAVVLCRGGSSRSRRLVVSVDVLHGASMVALEMRSRGLRPAAATAAVEAFGIALLSAVPEMVEGR